MSIMKVNHPDAEKRSHHKADAAQKRLANKKEKEAADKFNDQWSEIDSAIAAEFQGIAEKISVWDSSPLTCFF